MQNIDDDQEDTIDQFQSGITRFFDRRVDKYAAIIGLPGATPEFRKYLTDAVYYCLVAEPLFKRSSETRKVLLRLSEQATLAKESLDHLSATFKDLPRQYHQLMHKFLGLSARIAVGSVMKEPPWFNALNSVAGFASIVAEGIKPRDKGGPPRMLGFESLVRGLARAYQKTTGRQAKVTLNQHRKPKAKYEGKFVALVEAALPSVVILAKASGVKFRYPNTPDARGKYIYDVTRKGSRKRKQLP